ncbi:hypothetical protein Spla01_04975 [Streptomyces platensis]|uniref:SEC-C motif protein n=1 Tax=Streptomyces platensis TaxID=58346 RepID=A0ABX3Y283_STRPT|nr:hypothetical protein BG653_01284 [Streptomyces platensis]
MLPEGTEPPSTTHPLLYGRHRVRRVLGLPHDDWDALADTVHSAPVSLDELHDPKRIWSLGSDNPAELAAGISRLHPELGAYREALSRPFPMAVLHWPATELTELISAYPALSSEYPSHEGHLSTMESSLRELSSSGTPNLGIVTGTVPSYEAVAASEGSLPDDVTLLPQSATTPATGAGGDLADGEGAGCWCGSTQNYDACHGGPGPENGRQADTAMPEAACIGGTARQAESGAAALGPVMKSTRQP